jgi:hypothetical protein
MQRKLFPQERVLTTWSAFRLTTHRLVLEGDGWSDSLLLHQLSGSAIERQHQPLLLALAAALLMFGLVSMNYLPGVYLLCGLLAVVCAVFYVATRRIVVRIYADGRTLSCTS